MLLTILRINAFINWLVLANAGKFFSGRNPDLAFKCEQGALGSYQVFMDPGLVPEDLLRRMKGRMVLQAGFLIWWFIVVPVWAVIIG